MSANYLAIKALQRAKRNAGLISTSGGIVSTIPPTYALTNLIPESELGVVNGVLYFNDDGAIRDVKILDTVLDFEDSADIPLFTIGRVGGKLYYNPNGSTFELAPAPTSGIGSPEGVVTGDRVNQLYYQISEDGTVIVTDWLFLGTPGTNTGWVTYA